jgi:hypothetical protein
LIFDGGGAAELFVGCMQIDFGFSPRREYIDGRAMSGGGPGAHTTWWRGQGVARTTVTSQDFIKIWNKQKKIVLFVLFEKSQGFKTSD